MSFLYPSFLWALTAVLIPFVIHLFNFRRHKKVYFSNVRFLRELQTQNRSRTRLREILLLTLRCMAIGALVLAFARPYFPVGSLKHTPASLLSIYIDNSFSMANTGRSGTSLDGAKMAVKRLVSASGADMRFHIVTNDFKGSEQRLLTRDNALTALEDIRISPMPRLYSDVIARQRSFVSETNNSQARFYAFTDAQKSTFDLSQAQPDTSCPLNIVVVQGNQINNVYIDSCWFSSPLQQKGFRQRLKARVQNNSNNSIEAGAARLYLNNEQIALSSFSAAPGATAALDFSFTQDETGFAFGRIEIDDHPISFDDKMFFAFDARMNVRVVLVNGEEQPAANPFTTLFANDSIFSLRSFGEQALDYAAFSNADLVVLNQLSEISTGLLSELEKFMDNGGSLLLVPSVKAGTQTQALQQLGFPPLTLLDTTRTMVANLDLASGFFEGVFEKMEARVNLPVVNRHFRLLRLPPYSSVFMKLNNGDPLLMQVKNKEAQLYLFTSPLMGDNSNFSRHALFVPVIYRIALSALRQPPLYYVLNDATVISARLAAKGEESPPHVKGLNNNVDIIPEQRSTNQRSQLFLRNQLSDPGHYVLLHVADSLMPLAFNYSRSESSLNSYSVRELSDLAAAKGWRKTTITQAAGEAGTGAETSQLLADASQNHVWKLFIILALVFFLAESLLLRFLK